MSAADDHRTLLAGAIRQLRSARAALEQAERARHEPLAVIGAGVRLPGGVDDPEAFWRLLRDGVDAVSAQLPARDGRRTLSSEPPADGRWAGQLANVDSSDADFFGLGALEAAHMDPQQRLVLEVAWEAMEDAGLPLERLQAANTGVFLGLYGSDYLTLQLSDPATINAYTGPGGALSIAANRLSYLLDLEGPSLAVDTACSSSLVAVHLACRALRQGDCDLALVGGVNVLLSDLTARVSEQVLPLSPTGRCRTFDAGADGIVRAEGCAMLLLQRASETGATRVRGLIRGTAVNQDGRSNGLTAPNPRAQSRLHRSALADAAAAAQDVVYIEAHGTGTPLGDPIEVHALGDVYGSGPEPCALGSVKTNLGHLEAAAGIVGLVKALLVLEHGQAPPHLHFDRLNPEIDLAGTRFAIPTELTALPPGLAAVSSFGFGGTNAHAVLAGAPARDDRGEAHNADDGLLLAISARSENALRELAGRYAERLAGGGDAADLCAAAALQRTHHRHRLGLRAADRDGLVAQLRAAATRGRFEPTRARPRLAFVFSGQGSQWTGMGRDLLAREPVFRAEVAACDALVRELAGWSVIEQLTAPDGRLHETEVAQVALAALQLGLVALWRSWGVEPDAVVGHSMGEIVAACAAGALDRAQALELLLWRARIAERAARGGAMASLELGVADVEPLVATSDGRVAIAAVNGPRSTVVSGEPRAVEGVIAAATAAGAGTRRLLVEYGFHSPLLDGCDAELAAAAAGLRPGAATLALYSSVTGGRIDARALDGAHWGRNLRDAVLLHPAIEALARDGVTAFVEIGPHPVLLRDIGETLEHSAQPHVGVASLLRGRPARPALHASLADLYHAGVDLRWDAILAPPRRPVALPSYPWQRRRHWLVDSGEPEPVARLQPRHEPVDDHTLYVRERVAVASGLRLDEVTEDRPLEALGLSSLIVVELRNQVQRELGVVVPLAALLGGGTPVDLARAIEQALAADAQRGAA